MSGYYLVTKDAHDMIGLVPTISCPMNQLLAMYMPDAMQVETAGINVAGFSTQKDDALKRHYGYDSAQSDEFLDATGIDATFTGHRAAIGVDKTTYLLPEDSSGDYGLLTSDTIALGVAIEEVTLTWNLFQLALAESIVSAEDRLPLLGYTELDPDEITARVSVDDGVTWTVVTNGQPVEITVPGATFRVQFENTGAYSGQKVWLGSWTALYNS